MKTFLTAEWRRLINLTYAVEPELLLPHLPTGTELDLYQGRAHVSLVAFDFINTKVKGVKIPFHINFPEINLRFYVRYGDYLGVCFIKELVPKFCIAYLARTLYNEPYFSLKMKSGFTFGEKQVIQHKFWQDNQPQTIEVHTPTAKFTPPRTSTGHYFKEHDLGFGQDHKGRALFYRVEHPVWEAYEVSEVNLNLDFAKVYGSKWGILTGKKPDYQLVAAGSPVSVSTPKLLKDWESWKHLFKGPENIG